MVTQFDPRITLPVRWNDQVLQQRKLNHPVRSRVVLQHVFHLKVHHYQHIRRETGGLQDHGEREQRHLPVVQTWVNYFEAVGFWWATFDTVCHIGGWAIQVPNSLGLHFIYYYFIIILNRLDFIYLFLIYQSSIFKIIHFISMSDSPILLFLIQMGLKSGIYGICYYNNITLISEKLRKLTYFFFFFFLKCVHY